MRLGVDLGGTKIEAVALGGAGEILTRRRRPSPQGDYRATIGAIADLVREIEGDLGRQGSLGVGIPGAISPATGLIKNANSAWLIGEPLDRDLSQALDRPVRVANDANCFALSEAVDGAGAGQGVVFGVILGTGVGGGLVVDRRPITGRHAIAGEWGHNPLPSPRDGERPGPACYCGRRGCIETFLSGPGLSRDHAAESGEDLDTSEIVRRAEAGEPGAVRTLERYEDRLARALATVINIVDPDCIVLGGGLSNVSRFYRTLPRLLGPHVFSDRADTPVLSPKHGDSSGVRGAAWLWPPETRP